MKYDITYACGHTATVQIYGSAAERERKAKWYESQECPDCYNAQGCTEVEMSYRDYKTNYPDCKTKRDSYDAAAKTIIVYVPVETPAQEPEQAPASLDDKISAVSTASEEVYTVVSATAFPDDTTEAKGNRLEAIRAATEAIIAAVHTHHGQPAGKTASGSANAEWFNRYVKRYGAPRSDFRAAYSAITTVLRRDGK